MSMVSISTPDAGSLKERGRLLRCLRAVTARMRMMQRLGRLALGLALFAAVLLVWVIVDALAVVPVSGRVGALFCVAVLAIALLGWTVLLRRGGGRDDRQAGAMIDRDEASGRMDVLVGLDLANASEADDPLSLQLTRRAIEQGCQAAEAKSPREVLPTRLLGRPMSRLWLAVVGLLVLALLFPGLVPSGLHRLVAPTDPLPAYNLTRLDVSWSPADPAHGADVAINVATQGLKPTGIDLVLLDRKGDATDQFALMRQEEDRFTGALRSLREPIRFVLVVNGRRSAVYTISPQDEEAPDDLAGEDEAGETDMPDGETARTPAPEPSPEAQAFADTLAGLLEQLASLTEQIEQAQGGDAQALAAVRDAIDALLASAEEGAAQADAMAGSGVPDALADALSDLAQKLSAMGLGSVPAPPGDSSPSEPLDGQAGEAWLDEAAQGARQDEQALSEGLGALESASDSGTSNRGGGPSDPPPRDPSAAGRFEGDLNRVDSGNLPKATLGQVPARYRDHIAAYFRQLAQDPANPPPTEDRP